MSLLITGGTIIDGTGKAPIGEHAILVEGTRIEAILPTHSLPPKSDVVVIDARGKYVIPGMMNANVHLFAALNLEGILGHLGHYEDLIVEAAQVALRGGLTTVFDTWGPRRFLMSVRDRINSGQVVGSRIFCAGNIIGFDGPFSSDFLAKATEVVSASVARRINSIWVENVGRHLMWLTPEQVSREVSTYIDKGTNFVKYASNDHYPGASLVFSPSTQAAIVDVAHRAGLSAQAHSLSVEGLRIAIDAGCDLITHCNVTGPVPIPESTLELFCKRRTGAVIFPWTNRGLEWITRNCADLDWRVSDINARSLIKSDAVLLLANDGAIYPPEMATDPAWSKWSVGAPYDNLFNLGEGHFTWFRAMEEKGCEPMRMLQAATRNIAEAYGKGTDLGTVQPGKLADMIILDKNPLAAAENYRSMYMVIKDGVCIDRDALPTAPVLTMPLEPAAEEERFYVPFIKSGAFPLCPTCSIR